MWEPIFGLALQTGFPFPSACSRGCDAGKPIQASQERGTVPPQILSDPANACSVTGLDGLDSLCAEPLPATCPCAVCFCLGGLDHC